MEISSVTGSKQAADMGSWAWPSSAPLVDHSHPALAELFQNLIARNRLAGHDAPLAEQSTVGIDQKLERRPRNSVSLGGPLFLPREGFTDSPP